MKAIIILFFFLTTGVVYAQTFTLKSKDLGGQATDRQVLNGFGCKGQNISPQLFWENPPVGTQSFAVTVFDENAPTGSGWWHWLIFDIDKNCLELKAGAGSTDRDLAPLQSVQSKTDFGTAGYGGPCPPPGSDFHRYIITVYALKAEKLGLDANTSPAMVGFYLSQNVLEKASLIFYYKN
jgi:Raf kinase inhibitor-like YbhB/YbcL family protein